jgi:hypothetical protein
MSDDPMGQVLRLVAEGRLTAEEAAPILDALDATRLSGTPGTTGSNGAETKPSSAPRSGTVAASNLRVQVFDGGRSVVNLRIPLALGRAALGRVPGLSDETSERIREAIDAGLSGPILDVDDDGDGVRISIE